MSRTISEALNAYLRDANEENARGTERGSVLVWTSILDDMMLRLLTKHFVELNSKEREQMFTHHGPASSLSHRIALCFALGLIDKQEREVLQTVKSIRNMFAHKLGITLNGDELRPKCAQLYTSMIGETAGGNPRQMFSSACSAMLMLLWNRIDSTERTLGVPDDRLLYDRPYGTVEYAKSQARQQDKHGKQE